MPSLSETQLTFRNIIAGGNAAPLLQSLRARGDISDRLDIYRRHYTESFRRHLRGRYPTVEWLLGTGRFVELADLTLLRSAPRAPCLAEYGAELVQVIGSSGGDLPPYMADVARLDWALGRLSVAVSGEPIALMALAALEPQHVPQLRFTLQPGLAFEQSDWPVDELVHLRLQDSQPAELAFAPQLTFLQLRGARGQFSLQRLLPGVFAFRSQLASGATLGAAAGSAVEAQADFELSAALAALFAEGLVINTSGETDHA